MLSVKKMRELKRNVKPELLNVFLSQMTHPFPEIMEIQKPSHDLQVLANQTLRGDVMMSYRGKYYILFEHAPNGKIYLKEVKAWPLP